MYPGFVLFFARNRLPRRVVIRPHPPIAPQFTDTGTDGAVGDYFDGDPIVRLADGRAHCKLCDTVLKTVSIARQHATRIHMSVAAECVLCARVYKNEKSFAMHLIRVHGLRGVEKPLENYGRVVKSGT